MFLQVCVCPQGGGGCLPQCMLGCHTPPGPGRHPPDQADPPQDQADTPGTRQTPPQTRQTPPRPGRHNPPWDQADTPGTRQTPPLGSRLQHTVYEQLVRILLECILVSFYFTPSPFPIIIPWGGWVGKCPLCSSLADLFREFPQNN